MGVFQVFKIVQMVPNRTNMGQSILKVSAISQNDPLNFITAASSVIILSPSARVILASLRVVSKISFDSLPKFSIISYSLCVEIL